MRKKVLSTIIVLCMVLALIPTIAFAADFTDTDGNWAEGAIDRWADEGVVNGEGDGKFAPDNGMTRAEFAQTVVNLMKLKGEADLSVFTDIDADAWYVPAVEHVYAAKIMNGDSDTTMSPDGDLSREMMFVMIARALGVKPADTCEKTVPDIEDAEDYAVPYINALVNMGVLKGTDALGSVEPASVIDRAAAVTVLDRLIGGYANEEGETVQIKEGTVTLVVADNVKVEGTADPDLPIVVAGDATKVDVKGVTGSPSVLVTVNDVAVSANPGTTVTTDEGVEGVTANGHQVSEDTSYTIPSAPTTTYVPDPAPATYAVTATVTPAEGGTATVEVNGTAAETAEEGDEVVVTVALNKDYKVKSVDCSVEGATVSDNKCTISFTMPGEAVTVTVTVWKAPTITGADGNQYTWDPDEKEWFDESEEYVDPAEVFGGDPAERDDGEEVANGEDIYVWHDDIEEWVNTTDGKEYSDADLQNQLVGGAQEGDVEGVD